MVMPTDAMPGSAPLSGHGSLAIDATDRRILALLCEDGRMSIRSLADRAGVSRSGAYARVERLRATGVIEGYGARLSPERLGLQVTAHVFVTLQQDGWQAVLPQLRAIPEVVYCAAMAADHDVFLIVRAASMEAIRRVVLDRLQHLPSVLRTRTTFVLEEESCGDAGLVGILDAVPLPSAAPLPTIPRPTRGRRDAYRGRSEGREGPSLAPTVGA
jgi:DNA-binding Lrp family transcriptional regulator